MNLNRLPRHPLVPSLCLSAALLGGCATKPPESVPGPDDSAPTISLAPAEPEPEIISHATTARDYRQDGARHLYGKNAHRIFKGKMPPLLQGVGTMVLQLDHRGNIIALNWARAPSHKGAQAEIERTVLASAPFPAPVRMGRVTYIDTWLWDKSGQFQLDTLTEGQRNR